MSSSLSVVQKLGPDVPGAMVIAAVAMVELVIVALLLIHMLLTISLSSYAQRMASDKERKYLTSPRGLYIVCLFISNFISAVGGVIEIQWIGLQGIEQGPTCTTQAFLTQLGGNATALWIGIISMSALSTFMFRTRSLPLWAALLTIAILWIAMISFDAAASAIFAGSSKQFFYGIAGLWCWITPSHRLARLFTQYVWMWFWSLVSAVCFIFVYLSVRGNIVVKRDESGRHIKWNKGFSGSWLSKSEEYEGLVGAVGKTMCWFPICYITLIIPMSVSRVAETFGFPVPLYALVFAAVNALLVGIVNAGLYFALRHSLKRGSSSEDTLRGSYGADKFGTESFEAPQEKRPSPISKPTPYPWTPTPTTMEWVPPSPHRGQDQVISPPSSVVAYAVTSGEDGMNRSSIFSNAPPRQAPVSTKLAQRSRSFHRPMESISTVTSSATVLDPSSQLQPVAEAEPAKEATKPLLTLPPPALVARRQSTPSPNIISPSELDKLTFIPLSPGGRQGHQRSGTDGSVYTGPRAISPDVNALMDEPRPPVVPSGPLPPPRKQKRALTPSVPVDVDESDMGSFSVSAQASVQEFDRNEIRPMSLGDVATSSPDKRTDSMHTFWAAYDQTSPKTPNMPADTPPKSRDTMRTFWAAYEGSSPKSPDMPVPAEPDAPRRDTMRTFWAAYEEPRTPNMPSPAPMSARSEAAKSWKSTARSSGHFQGLDSAVSLKPSISAVGRAPALPRAPSPAPRVESPAPPPPPPKDTAPLKDVAPLRPNPAHRRSRSLTSAQGPSPGMLRPATSAIARYGSPGLMLREGPSRHTPMPSDSSHTSDVSYRPPRRQPGYL